MDTAFVQIDFKLTPASVCNNSKRPQEMVIIEQAWNQEFV